MSDAVNSNDLSDRIEAVWRLAFRSHRPIRDRRTGESGRPARGRARSSPPTVGQRRAAGRPRRVITSRFRRTRVRQREPERAGAWRLAVRRVLSTAYASGLRIGQADRDGYVLTANTPWEGRS